MSPQYSSCPGQVSEFQEDPHHHDCSWTLAILFLLGLYLAFFSLLCVVQLLFDFFTEHIIDMLGEVDWTIVPSFIGSKFRFLVYLLESSELKTWPEGSMKMVVLML